MSCEECDRYQEEGGPVAFIRVERANVLVLGCPEHVLKLFEAYRCTMTALNIMADEDGMEAAMQALKEANVVGDYFERHKEP